MSRESRLFKSTILNTQDTISHYEAFGWELLSINGDQITMSRETQNPVYSDLVKYQAIYEQIAEEYARLQPPVMPIAPPKIDAKTCLISFVCFVLPCVAYLTYKFIQKKKYNEEMEYYNQRYTAYMNKRNELRAKMDDTVLQSRAVFFSKQS